MSQPGTWKAGLFECFSPIDLCCMAFWCPCIVYGKNKHRNDGEMDPPACTGSCWGWAGLAMCCNPFQGLLQMSTRQSIRREHGVDSNGCNDCLISCFCGCCALIQEDKETKSEKRPLMQQGYSAPNGGQGMSYAPPPGQQMGVQQQQVMGKN